MPIFLFLPIIRKYLVARLWRITGIEKAIYHFKNAISIDKNHAKAHYNLALMYNIQKKYKDAQNHFEKAIDIINDYSKAHFHLAMLLKEMGLVIPTDHGKSSRVGRQKPTVKK